MPDNGLGYEKPWVARLLIAAGVGGPAILVAFMAVKIDLFWFVGPLVLIGVSFMIVQLVGRTLLPALRTGSIQTRPEHAVTRSHNPLRYWLFVFLYVLMIAGCGPLIWAVVTAAVSRLS